MATNYPAGLDNFTNPTGTDPMNTPSVLHSQQHANLNDAMEAVQVTLGVDPQHLSGTVSDRITAIPIAGYVYDTVNPPDGVARFDDFTDLIGHIVAAQRPATISFPQDDTIPAGTYDFDQVDISLLGNGIPSVNGPGQGGRFITLADGVEFANVGVLTIGAGLGLISDSDSPVIQQDRVTLNVIFGAGLACTGTAPFADLTSIGGELSVISIQLGAFLIDQGHEVVAASAGSVLVLNFLGSNAGWQSNTLEGTGTLILFVSDASSAPDIFTVTQANFSGVILPTLPTLAKYVAYDPTASGMTATNVQDAIDELRGLIP